MATACRIAARFHTYHANVRVHMCNTNVYKNNSGHLIGIEYSLVLMTTLFKQVEDLIGQSCTHGSPCYPLVEVIADIVPFAGKALNGIINIPLWEIQFKSGCFTVLKEQSLHNLRDTGSCSYRRAGGFDAYEEIRILQF